jgi:hypothetical protein
MVVRARKFRALPTDAMMHVATHQRLQIFAGTLRIAVRFGVECSARDWPPQTRLRVLTGDSLSISPST